MYISTSSILKALQVVVDKQGQAAIAVPDNDNHREIVGKVSEVLLGIGVALIWVSPEGVEIQWPSPMTDG